MFGKRLMSLALATGLAALARAAATQPAGPYYGGVAPVYGGVVARRRSMAASRSAARSMRGGYYGGGYCYGGGYGLRRLSPATAIGGGYGYRGGVYARGAAYRHGGYHGGYHGGVVARRRLTGAGARAAGPRSPAGRLPPPRRAGRCPEFGSIQHIWSCTSVTPGVFSAMTLRPVAQPLVGDRAAEGDDAVAHVDPDARPRRPAEPVELGLDRRLDLGVRTARRRPWAAPRPAP